MSIGIMSAMPEENDRIVAEIEGPKRETKWGNRLYHQGYLWGLPCVVVFSRWGKVAAATTTTHLICDLGVREIIFTGVAGSADPSVTLGDVVVARQLYQHDMNASPLFPPYEIPLLAKSSFESTQDLRSEATKAAQEFIRQDLPKQVSPTLRHSIGIRDPKAVVGDIASGDRFFAHRSDVEQLKSSLPQIACVEMEGAAVAQVCHEHDVRFCVIRTISDSADESAEVDFGRFAEEVASVYSHGIVKRILGHRTYRALEAVGAGSKQALA